MSDNKLITFDSEYRIRVLDADKHAASQALQQSCATFDEKVDQLRERSEKYIGMLETVSESIEAEKLRAIGLRNKVAAVQEKQQAGAEEISRLRQERQRQLDALTQEERSLHLVVEEQQAQIARLKEQSLG